MMVVVVVAVDAVALFWGEPTNYKTLWYNRTSPPSHIHPYIRNSRDSFEYPAEKQLRYQQHSAINNSDAITIKKSWLCRTARKRIPCFPLPVCWRVGVGVGVSVTVTGWKKERKWKPQKQTNKNKFYANVAWLSCERSFNSKWFQATFYFNSTTN